MPKLVVKELLESGLHFGHRGSRWNPKMKSYIFGRKNRIHIINLRETVMGMLKAFKFLKKCGEKGQSILWVGTKRQAREIILDQAKRTEMPYVVDRWLGGTLTNLHTIRQRISRLEELEQMEADGSISTYSKKMIASFQRERAKIHRNLEGIRKMTKVPSALVVVDPHREYISVAEANRLHIPVIALIDTDSDPDKIDIPIPGNDDAMKSITLVCSKLGEAFLEGLENRKTLVPEALAKQAVPGKVIATPKEVEKKRRRPAQKVNTASRRTSTSPTNEIIKSRDNDKGKGKGKGKGFAPRSAKPAEAEGAPEAPAQPTADANE